MRIIHTSDWHIGRTLHGVDLHDYHAQYFEHLLEVVRSEDVDAVVVSGDVYDRAVPPVDSVELLSETIARLSEHTSVVLTPGNHDSAIRLGFGANLMRSHIHIQSKISQVARPIEVDARDGGLLRIYGLPYLDPEHARNVLEQCCAESDPAHDAGSIKRSHESVTRAALSLVKRDISTRARQDAANVIMAHSFVVGGQASESERDIRVGGVDSVPAGVFEGFDYIALGHLHGAQKVSVPGTTARYSGSPLAFSFSEMNHKKSSVLVSFENGQIHGEPELIPAPVERKLSQLSGSMEELLGAGTESYVNDWMRIYVTDPLRPQEMNARLKARFPHALVMQHAPQGIQQVERELITVNAQTNPTEVATRFVHDVTTVEPSPQEIAVLDHAMDRARAQERSA